MRQSCQSNLQRSLVHMFWPNRSCSQDLEKGSENGWTDGKTLIDFLLTKSFEIKIIFNEMKLTTRSKLA